MYAKLIKQLRDDRKISQEELAQLIGVSRPTLANIEKGEKELNVSQLQKICDYFEISLEAFLKGKITTVAEVHLEQSDEKQTSEISLRISVPQEKVTVFKEVLLYILNKVGGKPNVGQTVLYKLLYFIDLDYYEKFETQLIGARYIRNHFGPTPAEFGKIVKQMIKSSDLEEVKSEYFNHLQTKYLALRKPDLSVISGAQKEHIDSELARLSDMTATELSELSHQDVPWIIARQGEVIDYESVFYRTPQTSQRVYDGSEL